MRLRSPDRSGGAEATYWETMPNTPMNDILEGYASAATPELIEAYETVSTSAMYVHVMDLLPRSPVRIVDIGAGTGRDAAWFSDRGHRVLAVEPTDNLRVAGMALHRSDRIEWLSDHLPGLARTQGRGPFDLAVLCGVWQHLDDDQRERALSSLSNLIMDGGMTIMSLRHGPGAPDRRVIPVDPDRTIEEAQRHGFRIVRRVEADAIQASNRAMGFRWTWLAMTMHR